MATTGDVELGTDVRFAVTSEVRTCELDGELVLLDIKRGEYFGLGELGTRAWLHLSKGRSVGEIAEQLAPDYDVEIAVLRQDLVTFVRDLERAGLIVSHPS